MPKFQSTYTVHDENFDGSGFTNENSIIRALGDKPEQAITTLTHLFGNWGLADNFPLLALTEGQKGGFRSINVNSIQYEYPVIGKRKTTERILSTAYSSTSKPGVNHTEFDAIFVNRWFAPGQTIRSQSGVQARVMYEPAPVAGGGHLYKLRLFNPDPTAYCPPEDLMPGKIWGIGGGSTVTQSLSTGNWSPVQTPGKRKNQISFIRKSFRLGGNIANKKVSFKLKDTSGRETMWWLDFETFQHMLAWRHEKEMQLWLSEYSRNQFGQNPLVDPTNQLIIPTGAGLRQQIYNVDTYSTLTDKRIKTIIGDVFRGANDTQQMNIILYGGEGFFEEFDNAMKNSTIFQLVAQGVGEQFVQSTGNGLVLGGYFTSYKTVDGHMVTLKRAPFLDNSGYADASGVHPVTGRPLSSYEGYFVDHSTYDGVPNVQLVYEQGRMEVRGVRQGMTVVPGSSYGDFQGMSGFLNLATEVDETSIHYMASCGIQMLRDTHSFRLELAV